MTPSRQVDEIAASLTKAQKAHLATVVRDIGNPPVWLLCSEDALAKRNLPTRVVLARKGLLESGHRFGPTVLTPLGLEVRALLLDQGSKS